MKLLLDTHIVLWAMRDADELSAAARLLLRQAEQVFVSSVSLWEAVIKVVAGKLPLDPTRLRTQIEAAGFKPLDVSSTHALKLGELPMLHRDPFDRMLIAQALSEPLRLLTHDAALAAYSDLVTVV